MSEKSEKKAREDKEALIAHYNRLKAKILSDFLESRNPLIIITALKMFKEHPLKVRIGTAWRILWKR